MTSRGFGFITFASSEEASSAIQALDGQVLFYSGLVILVFCFIIRSLLLPPVEVFGLAPLP